MGNRCSHRLHLSQLFDYLDGVVDPECGGMKHQPCQLSPEIVWVQTQWLNDGLEIIWVCQPRENLSSSLLISLHEVFYSLYQDADPETPVLTR